MSNEDILKSSNKEWAYFQYSQYWEEQCFDDCKNEFGMSGYQVSAWLAWQHHITLVLMACFYFSNIKLKQ